MEITYILLAIIAVLAIVVVVMYNSLVTIRVRANEAWSDITVQLKRRYDLIPNLIETVKGYAKHEKGVFEEVTKARANALSAQGVKQTAQAENQFEAALKSLFAVSENYPQLRATENFQRLQTELTDTEDKIMAARRFYNAAARDMNIKVETFPSSIIAAMFSFKKREFFEVENLEEVEKPVQAKF